jgi:hypothetical protein
MKCALLAAAFLLTITGCATTPQSVGPMMSSDAMVAPESAPGAPSSAEIITTGYLAISTSDPQTAAQQTRVLTAEAAGRIDQESESRVNDQTVVNLTLRIPAEEFTAVMDAVGDLGTVDNKSVSRVDVTTQVLDLDARIAVLQTSVGRMNQLLSEAESVSDLIAAEGALAERQGQLDSLVSQRDYLKDQVTMSTITVTIAGSAPTPLTTLWATVGGVIIGIVVGIVIGFVIRRKRVTP